MSASAYTTVKWTLLLLIAGLAILPAVQKAFRPFYPGKLDGYSEPVPLPSFSTATVFDGTFPLAITRRFDRGTGFHNGLVRLHNQIDFSLFRVPHAKNVIIGKEDYLFEEQYIKAWSGMDFIGEDIIEARAKQFRFAQDWLMKEKGVLFLVLLLPDKGSFYPEKIPARYGIAPGEKTNYSCYRDRLALYGVNFIDFNAWFLAMKDTCLYPLYPKCGIHWSGYGSWLAIDSLVRFLGYKTGVDLPHPECEGIRVDGIPEGRENDVEKALNLACPIGSPPMAHPDVAFTEPRSRKTFSALFIGDSFYFTWAEAGYIGKSFTNRDFWYYDHEVWYGTYNTGKAAEKEDLMKTLDRMNAVVIMQTNAGYGELGYYFVDRMLEKAGFAGKH